MQIFLTGIPAGFSAYFKKLISYTPPCNLNNPAIQTAAMKPLRNYRRI
jgi:hypothetical protein